ncbi:tetratricopeptide repeat protein [Sphingomicrobium nitratireducens]|uniref:tetratricopeptide repeat protein n=1 Tax=Sphingomicrobium nitratireducens TaxID=2964666 RepID=UPI00223FBBDB|nr:tetratricopeptide repeat protein [Sphingomicrobium nitratireducens]
MTGFLLLGLVALALLGGLRIAGVRGSLWTLAAAAMAFGAAGYALTGRPGLPGDPRAATSEQQAALPLTGARQAFFGRFNTADRWMTIAEGYAGRGKTGDAVGVLRSAVREHPRDFALWTGLGNALVDHGRTLTPAAQLAYERAVTMAPGQPGPVFFYALAKARTGDREGAIADWQSILDSAPSDASWRPLVEQGIVTMGGAVGGEAAPADAAS